MRPTTRARRLVGGLLAVPLALTTVAATAPDGCYVAVENDPETTDDDVIACERATWVADAAGTKVGNLAATGQSAYPTLSDDEPTASVSTGAGAGYLGTSLLQITEPRPDASGFTIKGEYTGALDRLSLTLHGVHSGFGKLPFSPSIPPGVPENPNPTAPTERSGMTAYVSVEVDGLPVVPLQTVQVEFTTDAAPTASASERYRANLTGLAQRLKAYRISLDEGSEHTITIRVTPRYVNTDPAVVFLYGTSEVPSSVVLNQVELDPEITTVGI